MPLEARTQRLDDLLGAAEQAEQPGDLANAASPYTTAIRADPTDPLPPFSLGKVFQAQGRATEAWYDLALAAEDEQQADLAVAQYRRAVQAQPDYADAHGNPALLLTRLERCAEALDLWQRYLELEPAAAPNGTAHKAMALCRLRRQQDRTRTG